MVRRRNIVLGACLICTALVARADELAFSGKSAQEAFNHEGVVKLLKAAIHGDAQEAQRLVDSGVNANSVGESNVTPLLWVLAKHDLKAVKVLLDVGADPNKSTLGEVGEISLGYPPVFAAASGGLKEALQMMLDRGGDSNVVWGNESALMIAIGHSHLDCAELLLEHGADINYHGHGISAIDMAMIHVQFADALWALEHGYVYNLPMARRMLARENPRPGQEAMKGEALAIVDRMLTAQQRKQ